MDANLVVDGFASEFPVSLSGGKSRDCHVVVQEDVRKDLVLVKQGADVEQILVSESLAKSWEALPDCLHLLFVGRAIDWDELAAHLHFSELGSELRSFDEEATLVESSEESLESFLLMGVGTFELVEEVEKCLCPQVVPSEALMQGVAKSLHQFEHVLDIEEVEAKGVLLCRLVEVATAETVPKGDVGADLGGYELRESTHAGH